MATTTTHMGEGTWTVTFGSSDHADGQDTFSTAWTGSYNIPVEMTVIQSRPYVPSPLESACESLLAFAAACLCLGR